MEHIIELNRNKKLNTQKCFRKFYRIKWKYGISWWYKSNYNLKTEKNNYEVEKYFEEIEGLKQVTGWFRKYLSKDISLWRKKITRLLVNDKKLDRGYLEKKMLMKDKF